MVRHPPQCVYVPQTTKRRNARSSARGRWGMGLHQFHRAALPSRRARHQPDNSDPSPQDTLSKHGEGDTARLPPRARIPLCLSHFSVRRAMLASCHHAARREPAISAHSSTVAGLRSVPGACLECCRCLFQCLFPPCTSLLSPIAKTLEPAKDSNASLVVEPHLQPLTFDPVDSTLSTRPHLRVELKPLPTWTKTNNGTRTPSH